jgi:hypothetical protein
LISTALPPHSRLKPSTMMRMVTSMALPGAESEMKRTGRAG